MAKTIKIMDGFKLTVDDQEYEYRTPHAVWDELMDDINIPKDKDLRTDLFRKFFAFGVLDLSEAYQGHYVCINVIPVGE